jgi:hypothetical protein
MVPAFDGDRALSSRTHEASEERPLVELERALIAVGWWSESKPPSSGPLVELERALIAVGGGASRRNG